ncbi:DHS-like NAD/FAD-binding domain-containing protein [Lophiotrema nucula]|uniref:DHS-like NAD/FAD-binding domain-containing protein n=1 Tax=Lophiotrema nucula TaxID=690887 RepID=A0A6A5YN69_9PLEO|nr:DHS-like NAD/FAD-binding domain-containing protein [Lophiotrema nucula]
MAYDLASDSASSPLSSAPSLDTPMDSDSEISMLSNSPSPPPELFVAQLRYPSPSLSSSSSQRSSRKASPAPASMTSTPSSCGDDRPRKKRKLADSDNKERPTKRLDLSNGEFNEEERPQLERLLKTLHKKRKIVVIAGAGISVSAGIPDFRSSTGLFKSLRKEHKLKSSGKDLFDASVYKDDTATSSFHDMVRQLSQSTKNAEPTAFHHLLASLAQEGRLLRLYTQNVDGIDTSLPPLKTQVPFPKKGPFPKTVQLHGGLEYMVCSKCHALSDFDSEMFVGPVPPACPQCVEKDEVRQAVDKRSHGIGRLRPRMVLYNEHNPDDEAIGACAALDLRTRPDAVIVAGTTLKVPGVRRIVREMCAVVRDRKDGVTVWINNDPEPISKDLANSWDLVVKGPCDAVAQQAAMLKWDEQKMYKEVTDDELKQTKAKQKKSVLIASPQKQIIQVQGQMLTPAQSPKIGAHVAIPSHLPPTPTKSNSRKRKSENGTLDFKVMKKPTVKPEKQENKEKAPPKKRARTSTKGKENSSDQRITDKFTAAKSTTKKHATKFIASKYSNNFDTENKVKMEEKMEEDTLPDPASLHCMTPKRTVTRWKLSDVPPYDVRQNGSPIQSPTMEPFTSPPTTPTHHYLGGLMTRPQSSETPEARPSSASSTLQEEMSKIVTPPSVPNGLGNLFNRVSSAVGTFFDS